MPKKKSVHLIS